MMKFREELSVFLYFINPNSYPLVGWPPVRYTSHSQQIQSFILAGRSLPVISSLKYSFLALKYPTVLGSFHLPSRSIKLLDGSIDFRRFSAIDRWCLFVCEKRIERLGVFDHILNGIDVDLGNRLPEEQMVLQGPLRQCNSLLHEFLESIQSYPYVL